MRPPLLIVSILLLFLFSFACRYKDNTNLNLKSVKKRLCKNWILKSAVSYDNTFDALGSISWCAETDLNISENEFGFIILKLPSSDGVGFSLEENKTALKTGGEVIFKITKLTNDELWMEGEPWMCRCQTQWINDTKLKYKYHAR